MPTPPGACAYRARFGMTATAPTARSTAAPHRGRRGDCRRAEFADGVEGFGVAARAARGERHDNLARQVVLRQERPHHVRQLSPPDGMAQVDRIVGVPIRHRRRDRRQIALVLLALHLRDHSVVVVGIRVGRLDAEQVGARRLRDTLGDRERGARVREHRHERPPDATCGLRRRFGRHGLGRSAFALFARIVFRNLLLRRDASGEHAAAEHRHAEAERPHHEGAPVQSVLHQADSPHVSVLRVYDLESAPSQMEIACSDLNAGCGRARCPPTHRGRGCTGAPRNCSSARARRDSPPGSLRRRGTRLPMAAHCLLYTSDAADE